MSATTIIESYDTQMDYSSDFDVAMHAAGSSDPWQFQGESIMDQDGHLDSHSSGVTNRDESVEVDMEDLSYLDYADNESVEYEMADDNENYHPEGELLDVEVYDASAEVPSPASMPVAFDTPQLTSVEAVDYTFQASPSFTDIPIAEPHEVSPEAHIETHDYEITAPHSFPEPSATAAVYDETPVVEFHATELPNHEAPASSTSTEAHHEALGGSAAGSHSEHLVHSTSLNAPAINNDASSPATVEDGVEPTINVVAQPEDSGAPDGEPGLPRYEQHALEIHPELFLDADAHAAYHDDLIQHTDVASVPEITNPLEPGFGVDPPPPIFLSFQSADFPEICLFNRPPVRSGSHSPTGEVVDVGSDSLTLLLHHRPLLYFATLDEVFTALREEEHIAQIPDVADGELILDAYDLQLVIPEDNAYAREISLHDLEYLHAGSDISGPLRLKLHVALPRFLNRYQALRDQVDRMNIAREASVHPDEHEGHYEEPALEPHTEDEQDLAADTPPLPNTTDALQEEVPTDLEGTDDVPDATTTEAQQFLDDGGEPSVGLHEELATNDASIHAHPEEDNPDVPEVEEGDYVTVSNDNADPVEPEEYVEERGYDESYGEAGTEGQDDGEGVSDNHSEATELEPGTDGIQNLAEANVNEPAATEEAPLLEGGVSEAEHVSEGVVAEASEETDETDETNDVQHSHLDTNHDYRHEADVDESDVNFIAILEQQADLDDPEIKVLATAQQEPQELQPEDLNYPELEDDPEWDDDLDAEGEIDTTWPADNDDGASNESSVTLSSSATISKRGYEEVDPDNDETPNGNAVETISPGPKRARIA